MLYKMDLLCIDADVYSVVNIRLDLETYEMKKRHRRVKRKAEQAFTVTCGRAQIKKDRQRLYEQHKARFKGFIHGTLDEYLHAGFHTTVFDTMEMAVYDGEKLIAASYFDLGDKSMASLLGIYDEDYADYSLGVFTMLKELEFGQSTQRKWYYPGYVLDQPSAFDYKLSLGIMEYYTPSKRWGKHINFKPELTIAHQLRRAMSVLAESLQFEGIMARKWYYPYFSMGYMPLWKNRFLHIPLVLELGHDLDGTVMVGYCPETMSYQLAHVLPCPDEQHFINMEQASEFNNSEIYLGHLLEYGDVQKDLELEEVVQFIQTWRLRPNVLLPSCNSSVGT